MKKIIIAVAVVVVALSAFSAFAGEIAQTEKQSQATKEAKVIWSHGYSSANRVSEADAKRALHAWAVTEQTEEATATDVALANLEEKSNSLREMSAASFEAITDSVTAVTDGLTSGDAPTMAEAALLGAPLAAVNTTVHLSFGIVEAACQVLFAPVSLLGGTAPCPSELVSYLSEAGGTYL